MDSATPYDRIRAWVTGELSPDEVERLRQELARDPELAAFADAYRQVHELTSLPDEALPASSTRFEQLPLLPVEVGGTSKPTPRPLQLVRRAAAVAAGILLAAVAWKVLRPASELPPLLLSRIPLSAAGPAASHEPLALPAVARDYRTVEDGAVRWLTSLDEATSAARVAGRPLLVLWAFPGCPVCREIRTKTINEEGVVSIAEMYVPVELDLTRLEDEERARALMGPGYPFIEVRDPDQGAIYQFAGSTQPVALREQLEQGLWERQAESDPPSWDDVRRAVALYERARSAEQEERYGEAQTSYAKLGQTGAGRIFDDAASDGLARIAAQAREALLAGRAAAREDAERAEQLLREAVARFDGTPFASDLAEVLERLRSTGRFPDLLTPLPAETADESPPEQP